MSAGEIVSLIAQVFYYGGWASLLLIPYGMFLYFSNEKKELEKNALLLEDRMPIETSILKKE